MRPFKKSAKYKNKKVLYDGHKFDSIKEKNCYIKYKAMQEQGLISNLTLQPKFILLDKFRYKGEAIRALNYSADFQFLDQETGLIMTVDAKGYRTEVYKIKRKLLLARYPEINFIEV